MDSDTPFKRLRHRYGKPLWTPIHRSRRHDLWGAWSQLVPARLSACIKVTADLPRWMAKIYDGFWPYISNTLHIYIYILYTQILYIYTNIIEKNIYIHIYIYIYIYTTSGFRGKPAGRGSYPNFQACLDGKFMGWSFQGVNCPNVLYLTKNNLVVFSFQRDVWGSAVHMCI